MSMDISDGATIIAAANVTAAIGRHGEGPDAIWRPRTTRGLERGIERMLVGPTSPSAVPAAPSSRSDFQHASFIAWEEGSARGRRQ